MKAKNITILVCGIILSAFLLGATGMINMTSEATQENPRLIGVLITDEHLDLFDSERFFKENIHKLVKGGEIGEAESAKYQGRLYATLIETAHTDESGETVTDKEYVFNGVDGIRFFAPYISEESGSYRSTNIDEEITEVNHHIQSTNGGESGLLKGTVFVASNSNLDHFFFNPVYQTSSGAVYAVGGYEISFDDQRARVPGNSWSTTLSENWKVAAGGADTSSGTEVEVTVCVMDEPTNIALLQFNRKNELLARAEYRPGTLPERIDALSDTQYMIVETSSAERLNRTLFQREDDSAYAFYCRSDGICIKQECEIGWNHETR